MPSEDNSRERYNRMEESVGVKKETTAVEPKPDVEPKPEAEMKPKPEAKAEPEAEQKPKPDTEAKPEAEQKPKPDTEAKPDVEQKPEVEAKPKAEVKSEAKPKTFTVDEVNSIVSKRVSETKDKTVSALLSSLGLKTPEELAEIVKSEPELKSKIDSLSSELKSLKEEKALSDAGIDPMRKRDVRIYFKGLGAEINPDTLAQNIASHPEWVNAKKTEKPAEMKVLGNQGEGTAPESDEDQARDLFSQVGIKF